MINSFFSQIRIIWFIFKWEIDLGEKIKIYVKQKLRKLGYVW